MMPPEIVIARESIDAHARSCRARLARMNQYVSPSAHHLRLQVAVCGQLLELITGTWGPPPTNRDTNLIDYDDGYSEDLAARGVWPFVDADGNPDYDPGEYSRHPEWITPDFDTYEWDNPASF